MHDKYGMSGMSKEYQDSGKMPRQLVEYFKKKAAMGMKMPTYQGSGMNPEQVMQAMLQERMRSLGESELGQHQGERYQDVEFSQYLRPEDKAALQAELKETGLPTRIYGGDKSRQQMIMDFNKSYGSIGQDIYDADVARYAAKQAAGADLPKYGLNYGSGEALVGAFGDPSTDAYMQLVEGIQEDPRFKGLSKAEQQKMFDMFSSQADRFGEGQVDFSRYALQTP